MSEIKIAVRILPRESLLDVQGRSILQQLSKEAQTLSQVRMGKYIVLSYKLAAGASLQTETEVALKQAKVWADKTLTNSLTESYELEVLK